MANIDRPCGARPFGKIYRIKHYKVDSDATVIYPGDFVVMESDGNVVAATAGTGNVLLGASVDHSAASTAGTIGVYDHRDQEFVMQVDDTSVTSQASIGLNFAFIAGLGDATRCMSTHEIDGNTGTTATEQLRVLRRFDHPKVGWNTYTRLVVRINEHQHGTTAGV